eukprot:PhF_6_TR14232/c0_g1_i1/m.22821
MSLDQSSIDDVLRVKDEQIEALVKEFNGAQKTIERLQRELLETKKNATTNTVKTSPQPPPPPADAPFLGSQQQRQFEVNQTLTQHIKSLQRRITSLESEAKKYRSEVEAQKIVIEELNTCVDRAGKNIQHRDHELRHAKALMQEREDECRRLRADRVNAKKQVMDEITNAKESEIAMNQLRQENQCLREHVEILQRKIEILQASSSSAPVATVTEVREVPRATLPIYAGGEPQSLCSLRKSNQLLQEQ